jgi:hypothetical protein
VAQTAGAVAVYVAMATRTAPLGILITVALLALYAAYAAYTAYWERSALQGLVSGVAIVACVGTAMLKPWSRFLVYLLTATFIAMWGYSIYGSIAAGYFSSLPTATLIRLIALEACVAALFGFCAFAVYRYFRPVTPTVVAAEP